MAPDAEPDEPDDAAEQPTPAPPQALNGPTARTIFEIARETEAAAYLREVLRPDRYLAPDTSFAASWHTGAQLVDEILSRPPGLRVVELGSGTSTIWMGLALRRAGGGTLVAFEHDPGFLARTQEQVQRHGLDVVVTVVDAPLADVEVDGVQYRWYDRHTVRQHVTTPIDLLFVDGPPGATGELARLPAVPVLADRLADAATVVLDDVVRADEARAHELWMQSPTYGPRVRDSHVSGRSRIDRLGFA